jgi:hypothetical protein
MLTIAYITFRERPRFEWFVKSLRREVRDTGSDFSSLQVLVVDGRLWVDPNRAMEMQAVAKSAGGLEFQHVPPKPTVWQGPNRLTSKDYFAAANTRNTAFCYTQGSHVAFVDDLSVLRPGWLKCHLEALKVHYVLSGLTDKIKNIDVNDNGDVISFTEHPPGRDSRRGQIPATGVHGSNGSWLYGGTFSVPLEGALRVNGQDEICDSIGGEDYDFGIRLQRAGYVLRISAECATYEDEDAHHTEAPMVRLDKPCPGGPYGSNVLYNRLTQENRFLPLGNNFSLRDLRSHILAGGTFPVTNLPDKYWLDNQPLVEM